MVDWFRPLSFHLPFLLALHYQLVLQQGIKLLGDQICRFREGNDQDYLDVTLAYSINAVKYIQYLNENEPRFSQYAWKF
jgi:hypothetical protein